MPAHTAVAAAAAVACHGSRSCFLVPSPLPAAVVATDLESHSKPDQAAEPALKKQKTASSGLGDTQVIRPDLFSEQSRTRLQEELQTAQPYTHVVIQDLCDPAVLRSVREEVIHNISATYKETDLFKVFQTGARAAGQLLPLLLLLFLFCTSPVQPAACPAAAHQQPGTATGAQSATRSPRSQGSAQCRGNQLPPRKPLLTLTKPHTVPGDLANMDSLDPDQAAKLPNLMALRDAIYSPRFRK